LFVDNKYIGSGGGSGEADGKVFECYGEGVKIRLAEDGYVSYGGGVLEVGLLRDCGGAVGVREFEDGKIYVYQGSACGNGVFVGKMPVVYNDMNQVFATATFGSIVGILAVGLG